MIYADYNGSAPLLPSVREHLKMRLDSDLFANPNAIHSLGQKVSKGIERCREIVAEVMGCYPDQVFFNSGSSEGISHIFHSLLDKPQEGRNVIITSPIEHSVIRSALRYYETERGFSIRHGSVRPDGSVDPESVKLLLEEHRNQVALVTIMAANNETGVLQPYEEIAGLCRDHGVEFFSDTTQLIGKGPFHFEKSGLDYAVCSGHKLGALSGSGFLLVKEPTKLKSLVFGSSQERGLRGGTQHYLGIETLAIALKDFQKNSHKLEALKEAKLRFEREIERAFPEVVILGKEAHRLSGTTLIGYPGLHGQAVQIELESQDVFVTTSAACTDNQPETSKVLKAMGINDQVGRGVIRISLSHSHGENEYSTLASILKSTYTKLSKIKSF